jgi:hypothetical protein
MRIFSKSTNLAVSVAIAIASVGATADSTLFDTAGEDVIVTSAAVCDNPDSYATIYGTVMGNPTLFSTLGK